MDDFDLSSLSSSKDEWCARLLTLLTPHIIDGLRSIFSEADTLCSENEEHDQYLITFQTFLARVPKWNTEIISVECKRIEDSSNCSYLEDLITCVHVINLKALSCMRVGHSHKKVELNIPKLSEFLHKTYIICARKVYANVYLFEKNREPLETQRNNRELELLVKEGILEAIRENVPAEKILKQYLEQTEEITEDSKDSNLPKLEPNSVESNDTTTGETAKDKTASSSNVDLSIYKPPEIPKFNPTKKAFSVSAPSTPLSHTAPVSPAPKIKFSNVDGAQGADGKTFTLDAPKTIERLEKISTERNEARKKEEAEEEDEDDFRIKIGEEVKLDIQNLKEEKKGTQSLPPPTIEITDI